jgi:hypothetical protein
MQLNWLDYNEMANSVEEQKQYKVCLVPHRNITRGIYNPSFIRKNLELLKVEGVHQVYIPNRQVVQQGAYGSVLFTSAEARDAFLATYAGGLQLTPLPTDQIRVMPWYSREERVQHRVNRDLAKARGFFCPQLPAELKALDADKVAQIIREQLPNAGELEFVKTIRNVKNDALMASFLYKNAEAAIPLIKENPAGTFVLKLDDGSHSVKYDVYRRPDPAKRIYVRSPAIEHEEKSHEEKLHEPVSAVCL